MRRESWSRSHARREDHDPRVRRFTTSSGRDLIIFNERPERAAINGIFNDSAHTDTCNGDHTDVSGRCGANVEE